ncbi:putative cytochrome P450 6a14 [Vespula squamosa]|uniref:Cytochrome P450 6a14 n=1 Tax=Vespula squamosa TaxID=30214 RepID=A0ABD1ZZJ8_VESSQ
MTTGWILSELFGALLFIGITIYMYFKLIAFNFWRRRGVPYEEPTFPGGNINDTIFNKKSLGVLFEDLYRKNKSRPYVGIYSFFKPNLMINDPELIRFVMAKEFSSFHDRGMYCNEKIDPLSGHLFLLPGAKWKSLRTRLTPTFTSGKIKHMFETLQENGILLEKFLEKKAHEKNEIDIKEVFAGFFTDIIMSTAFGINCNCLEHPESEFRYWGKKVFEPKPFVNTAMIFASKIMEIFSIPLNDKGVIKFFMKTFEETVQYRDKHNIERRDFLNLIMQLMKNGYVKNDEESETDLVKDTSPELEKFSMSEAAAQAFVFYVAGFETTSSTVTFCLYELALNQDIQKKTQEEIDRVLKKHGGISYNAINEMTYLHMVICETLRKYPPLPILNRICTKDIELPNSNVVISEGTPVVIPILGIHRDSNIYPEPEKFIPERFTEEQIRARHHYTYLPFGEGPRICIGMRFGLIQTKVALTNALAKFVFLPGPKTQRKLDFVPGIITLGTKEGIYLQIQHRS